jgi:hypothetical protein
MKHKAKVLTKEEVEKNRSNAYTYINFESENVELPSTEAINYTPC